MTPPSTKPFGESLRSLMDERSLTYRGLAEATRKLDGKGITHAHINMLANGHDKPSMRAMELIAAACGVDPDYFAEYRLAAAMRELDPAEVGLEQALENLNARLGARRTSGARARPSQLPQAQPRPTG
jgi:transcriptional regulator with XRE-family HTH domain